MADSSLALSKVHQGWHRLIDFSRAIEIIDNLDDFITPNIADIFSAFQIAPSHIKVLIIGQDPYPNVEDATGLAFSVKRDHDLPKSLQNMFKELQSDIGGPLRSNGNLNDWVEQGVLMLNRVLTAPRGVSMGHRGIGWESFTENVISQLTNRTALLMGKSAQELSRYFDKKVCVAHPSPLSAHRGFFGSKPFSRINELLEKPIHWA